MILKDAFCRSFERLMEKEMRLEEVKSVTKGEGEN